MNDKTRIVGEEGFYTVRDGKMALVAILGRDPVSGKHFAYPYPLNYNKHMTKKIIDCDHLCSGNCRRNGCNCECGEWHDEPCGACGGSGEVSAMEAVYPGEPHMADVGSAPCPECRPARDDDDDQDGL